ncbi:hypothetical protein CDL15_Pgr015998 [Punica granatum]|uniref:Uncharacterized protein n=1 Tax=Punica granatum TaxID=22663 RepID=A0A218XRT2_PUNGR|nr:hypothetical protein CDL15_Pgr015998 [Punica granatum]
MFALNYYLIFLSICHSLLYTSPFSFSAGAALTLLLRRLVTPHLTGLVPEKPNPCSYCPDLAWLVSYGKPNNMSFRARQESLRTFDNARRGAPTPIHEEFRPSPSHWNPVRVMAEKKNRKDGAEEKQAGNSSFHFNFFKK